MGRVPAARRRRSLPHSLSRSGAHGRRWRSRSGGDRRRGPIFSRMPYLRTVQCSAVRQPEQCRPRSPAASHPIPTPRSGWPVQLGPPTVRGGACGGVPLQRSGRRAPTGTRAQTLALISAYWLTHSRPFMLYRFAMLVSCSNRSIDPAWRARLSAPSPSGLRSHAHSLPLPSQHSGALAADSIGLAWHTSTGRRNVGLRLQQCHRYVHVALCYRLCQCVGSSTVQPRAGVSQSTVSINLRQDHRVHTYLDRRLVLLQHRVPCRVPASVPESAPFQSPFRRSCGPASTMHSQ